MKNNVSSMTIEDLVQKFTSIKSNEKHFNLKDKEINDLLIVNDAEIKEKEEMSKSTTSSMNIADFGKLMKATAEDILGRPLNSKDIGVVKSSEMNDNSLMPIHDMNEDKISGLKNSRPKLR